MAVRSKRETGTGTTRTRAGQPVPQRTRAPWRGVLLALAAFLLVSAGPARTAEHEVRMLSVSPDGTEAMVFDPPFLRVELGDVVVFVPAEPGHNSTSVFAPFRGPRWAGEIDERVEVSFDKEGVYIYQCTPHSALGMVGVIQVGQPLSLDAARKAAERLKGRMTLNADRVDRYLSRVEP